MISILQIRELRYGGVNHLTKVIQKASGGAGILIQVGSSLRGPNF